jgi:hypothetical protein
MCIESGYTVEMEGHWLLAEKDGKVIDLVHIKTGLCGGIGRRDCDWGYKDESVTVGPKIYNAPLHMVKKAHEALKGYKYYQSWLSKYPKRKSVENKQPELIK